LGKQRLKYTREKIMLGERFCGGGTQPRTETISLSEKYWQVELNGEGEGGD